MTIVAKSTLMNKYKILLAGFKSVQTIPSYPRPYPLLAFVCVYVAKLWGIC